MLKSVAYVPLAGNVVSPSVRFLVKTDASSYEQGSFPIPLNAFGSGMLQLNLLVRPDGLNVAGGNDVFALGHGRRPLLPSQAGQGRRHAALDDCFGDGDPRLQRLALPEGKGVKVNRTLIRATRSGKAAGASYRFVDQVRGAKRGLSYRLQLVDLNGRRSWYAAFAVASR